MELNSTFHKLCRLFFVLLSYFRSNKDDGKKNEERTSVKKKGEYDMGT